MSKVNYLKTAGAAFILASLLSGCLTQQSAQVVDNSGNYYSRAGASRYTVVQGGETLSSIARKYGVKESEILSLNKLRSSSDVIPGKTLAIPFTAKNNEYVSSYTSKDVGYKPNYNPETGESKEGYLFSKKRTVTERKFETNGTANNAVSKEVYEAESADDIITESKLGDLSDASVKGRTETKLEIQKQGGEASSEESLTDVSSKSPISPQFKVSSPLGSQNFDWPVSGDVIQRYGKNGNKFNDGINIAAPLGTPVAAAAEGKVVYLGNNVEGYGNLVIIKHDSNFMTAYAHLKDVLVEKGVMVKRGESIGTIGQSGNISEPQLHFSVRKGKKTIDPEGMGQE